jgi:hypothetical protein
MATTWVRAVAIEAALAVVFVALHAVGYAGYDARESREHTLWNLAALYLPARAGAVAAREVLRAWSSWSSPFARRVEDGVVLAVFATVYALGGFTFRAEAAGSVARTFTAGFSKDVAALARAAVAEFAAQRGLFMYVTTSAAVAAAAGGAIWLAVWLFGTVVCGSLRACRRPADAAA